MNEKLIIIGVDGLDYDVVRENGKELRNLNRLLENNNYPRLRSVFPADTTPAWATIFTGKDPSEHGIINFVNIGDTSNKYVENEFDDAELKGKTFWDVLGKEGYRCTVLLPMDIKEGWDINGTMITRPYKGRISVFPKCKEILYKNDINKLYDEIQFASEKQYDDLLELFLLKLDEEYRLTIKALENEESDVFFTYFSVVDGVQHAFWSYCDKTHAQYPGENKYSGAITGIYKKIDSIVEAIIAMRPESSILVVSDHGHGPRPLKRVNINEILSREGYLSPIHKEKRDTKLYFKQSIKQAAIAVVKKYGLPKWIVRILRKIPLWKKMFVSSDAIDWANTRAYLSDLSAMKNYSYGGIRLNSNIQDEEKDALCDEIIEKLKQYTIPDKNVPVFSWIKRINTIYHGEYLFKYPEIAFQLDERYGASWDFSKDIIDDNGYMHQLSPGCHRYETAYIGTYNLPLEKHQYELTDVCKIIVREMEKK